MTSLSNHLLFYPDGGYDMMRTVFRQLITGLAVAALALLFTAVSPATDSAVNVQAASTGSINQSYYGRTIRKVAFRRSGSAAGKVLTQIPAGTRIRVLTTDERYVRVIYKNRTGYAAGRAIRMTNGKTAAAYHSKGAQIIAFALKFLGNPYRFGGTSLTRGADCSGFIMSIYAHFGVDLPRTSKAMRRAGYSVPSLKAAKPGDILCYKGHVALYMGGNRIVHASNKKYGICIRNNAAYKKIITIRRIFR